MVGAYTINSAGGVNTLDFSSTPHGTSITLDLTLIDLTLNIPQPVSGGSWTLTLATSIQNVIDGQGDNTITATSGVHRIILLPYYTGQTVTVKGNGGNTTLDFSAFTTPITVCLGSSHSISYTETISGITSTGNIQLNLPSGSVDNVIGGAGGGTLRGNADNDTFTITGGANTIVGNSSSANNTVNASADADFILTANSLSVGGVGDRKSV